MSTNFRQPSDALSDVSPGTRRQHQRSIEGQARRVQVAIPISGDPRPNAGRGAPPPPIGTIPAVVTAAIGPAAGTTLGTGQAQLYYLDQPTDTSATADAQNASVPVKNWFVNSGTIAIGTHVQLSLWSGAYWYAGGDC